MPKINSSQNPNKIFLMVNKPLKINISQMTIVLLDLEKSREELMDILTFKITSNLRHVVG